MNYKLKTQELKRVVNKAIQGAGFNNLVPISGMMGIRGKDGILSFLTTDLQNNLEVRMPVLMEKDEEFNVTVDADKFVKLINKITLDELELRIVDNKTLVIVAGGWYKFPLVTDEEGLVRFKEIESRGEPNENPLKVSTIKNIKSINGSALSKTFENIIYTGYYVDKNMVVSTDSFVLTFNKTKLFDNDNSYLLPGKLIDLLCLSDSDCLNWDFYEDTNKFIFSDDEITIEGPQLEGIENYAIEAMKNYLETKFNSNCKIHKGTILSILDRICLFVEPYDNSAIRLDFGRTGITTNSKKETANELIRYLEKSEGLEEFSCLVDAGLLKEQIEAVNGDEIEIYFGNENVICLASENVKTIICLVDEGKNGK